MNELEHIKQLCKGDQSAIEFCASIIDVSALYDDLIDKDKPITDEMIHHLMWVALVVLPRNTFYQNNFHVFNPLIMNAIQNWKLANQLEKEQAGADDLSIAFIVRSSYADILRMVAYCLGGDAYALECGVAIRRFVHDEGFAAYREEMTQKFVAKEGA